MYQPIKVTLGTGGFTNANEYYKPNTDLSNGWNSFNIDIATAANNTLGAGLTSSDCDS